MLTPFWNILWNRDFTCLIKKTEFVSANNIVQHRETESNSTKNKKENRFC